MLNIVKFFTLTVPLIRKSEYHRDEIELSELSRSLAHPARIAILKLLAQQELLLTRSLPEFHPLAPATVLQHLKEMKKDGLIISYTHEGSYLFRVNWEKIDQIKSYINTFTDQLHQGKKA